MQIGLGFSFTLNCLLCMSVCGCVRKMGMGWCVCVCVQLNIATIFALFSIHPLVILLNLMHKSGLTLISISIFARFVLFVGLPFANSANRKKVQ